MRVNILVGGRFHSVTLADALSRLGADTVIYTSAPPGHFRSGSRTHATSFVPMPMGIARWLTGWDTERWETLDSTFFDRVAAFKMRRCDVLHGWAGYSLRSAENVKRQGGSFVLERSCPHVDFQESLLADEAEKLGIPYYRKTESWMGRTRAEYELADYIVVPSQYSRKSFIERGFAAEKIVSAPLDFPMLYRGRPPARERRDEFVVGTLGGNLLRKGFLYLLEAWMGLALPNAKLLIKASERDLRRSPRLAALLDSCSNVEILGYIDDISQFYRRCDAFCLASIDDGFGLVTIEALANGVPVVVTEHVGAAEILRDADAGYVVPPRSSEAIAEKLLTLQKDRELRARLSENALRLSERLTETRDGYFDRIQDLYQNRLPRIGSKVPKHRVA